MRFILIFYFGLGFASGYVDNLCPQYIQSNSFQTFINNYCIEHSNSPACENQQSIVNILNLYSEGFDNFQLNLPSQNKNSAQIVLSQISSALYENQSTSAPLQNLNCNAYTNLLFVMFPRIYKQTLVTNCQGVISGSSSVNYLVPYQYYQNRQNQQLCDYLKNNYQFCNKMAIGSSDYKAYNCDIFNNSKQCYEKTEAEILDILFNNYLIMISQCADSSVVMDDLFYSIDYGNQVLNNAQSNQVVCSNTFKNIGYVINNLNLDNMSSEFNYHLVPYLNYYFPSGQDLINDLSKYNNNQSLQEQNQSVGCGYLSEAYPGIEINDTSNIPTISQYLNPLISQYYYLGDIKGILNRCFPQNVTATLTEKGQGSYNISSPVNYNRYNYGTYTNDFVFGNLPACSAMDVQGAPNTGSSCFQINNNAPFSIGMFFQYGNGSKQSVSIAPYAQSTLCSSDNTLTYWGFLNQNTAQNPIGELNENIISTNNFWIWYSTAKIEINAN